MKFRVTKYFDTYPERSETFDTEAEAVEWMDRQPKKYKTDYRLFEIAETPAEENKLAVKNTIG